MATVRQHQDVQLLRDVGVIFTSLFRHHPPVQAEVKFFVREFEGKSRLGNKPLAAAEHDVMTTITQLPQCLERIDATKPLTDALITLAVLLEDVTDSEKLTKEKYGPLLQEQARHHKEAQEALGTGLDEKAKEQEQSFAASLAAFRDEYGFS